MASHSKEIVSISVEFKMNEEFMKIIIDYTATGYSITFC